MSHSKPSSIPSTSTSSSAARIVAAAITLLIPGAGPPPTRIASRLRWGTVRSPGESQVAHELLHHVGGLAIAGLEQEVGATAVRLGADDVEVGFGVGEPIDAEGRHVEAVSPDSRSAAASFMGARDAQHSWTCSSR